MTIVETPGYLARCKGRLTDVERDLVVQTIAADPECGELIVSGGGIRKIRIAAGGRGKSGGVRVIYYFADREFPAFLLWVFAKNEQANLTAAQRNALAESAKALRQSYRE